MLEVHDADARRGYRTRSDVPIIPVGRVSRYLKEALESDPVLGDIWISGELSNVSRSTNGHLYFTLKDAAGQVRSVMFRTWQSPVVAVKDGAAVVAHGRFSFYELRGDLQFIADVLMPQGQGALHLEFQRLRAKLEAEGLFDQTRKRRPPEFPGRIAVVTSPAGAVLHDILNVIGRRYPLVEVLVVPVAVQGETASASIVSAFRRLHARRDVDVVILARGGGSLEELWPFNEEATARAVYACRIPVISAVGHETDSTIVDFVADLRAPTPSAAAELAVPSRQDLLSRTAGARSRLRSAVERLFAARRAAVQNTLHRARRATPDLARERQRVDDLSRRGLSALRVALAARRSGLERCGAALSSLDPQRTLDRGYAVVQRRDEGRVITSVTDVSSGDTLSVRVKDGAFGAVAGDGSVSRPRRSRPLPEEQIALFR